MSDCEAELWIRASSLSLNPHSDLSRSLLSLVQMISSDLSAAQFGGCSLLAIFGGVYSPSGHLSLVIPNECI